MTSNLKLYHLILKSAASALGKQEKDGSMPQGHNGPWGCYDTPVRNTANWLKLFLFAYRETGDEAFLSAGKKSLNYLLSEEARPYNASFYCRRNDDRNKTNGLIGQAWVLESLIESYAVFNNPEIISVAKDVFCLHEFDETKGLWYEIKLRGEVQDLCKTFNQQLWFAAMGDRIARIEQNPAIEKRVQIFLKKLAVNFNVYGDGLIKHVIAGKSNSLNRLKRLKRFRKSSVLDRHKNSLLQYNISLGYHSFNLYAFALLKETHPDLHFWSYSKFKKALRFIETREYVKKLEDNEYGFGYNVAGIELAYILSVFMENSVDKQKYWIEKQFQKNYNFRENLLNRNTCDPETLSARLYEASRLSNIELNLAWLPENIVREKNHD